MFLKLKYNAISYTIFNTPPITNGADKNDSDCNIYPANDGDTACVIFLEILVTPAAAVRSFSLTTETK